jgi:HEAT repeat protein
MPDIGATLLFLLLAILIGGGAQNPADSNIQHLVEQLGSKNEQAIKTAAEALMKQGPEAVPMLVDALDRRKECQMQFVASGVLRRIDPTHSGIETALATLAGGGCSGNSKQDFIFKQEAAFALSRTVSGLERLADMVSHTDLATRRRVAFAFEDLTEKIDSPLEQARPPAALIEPTARALPKLAPFLADRDDMLRCVTLEAMEQASASRHPSIAGAAQSLLAGKKVSCGR